MTYGAVSWMQGRTLAQLLTFSFSEHSIPHRIGVVLREGRRVIIRHKISKPWMATYIAVR